MADIAPAERVERKQATQQRSVVVAVLTYRREQLIAQLVPQLVEQLQSITNPGSVLVVDNSPEATAESAVRPWTEHQPVRYVHEPRPGIAAGRNRAIEESTDADLLVFIDDDERPREGWLRHLVGVHERERCAAVVGPVICEFERMPDAWVRAGGFFSHRRSGTGERVRLAATNNLLLDLGVLRASGLRFDERFGITGGSDTVLTRQLTRGGAEIVWCNEAEVIDIVPASRSTRRWVLQRAYRLGNSWVRSEFALEDRPLRRAAIGAGFTVRGVARLIGGAARYGGGVICGSLGERARAVRTIARGAGITVGVFGGVYAEYRRS